MVTAARSDRLIVLVVVVTAGSSNIVVVDCFGRSS